VSTILVDNQPEQTAAVVDAPSPARTRVVIVGAGFAGLAAHARCGTPVPMSC
jgi:NADPH-dependent 2,4-dienoyl-CoA reductase/sulfur reductase-like enzyme